MWTSKAILWAVRTVRSEGGARRIFWLKFASLVSVSKANNVQLLHNMKDVTDDWFDDIYFSMEKTHYVHFKLER
jgi:hypothetical protein